jgi:hypothetical protein
MGVGKTNSHRPGRRSLPSLVLLGGVIGVNVLFASSASASSRAIVATTSTSSAGVLLALGGAVLVLGIVGFAVFTYTRRKRTPGQCAAQRDALELAEKSVQYWHTARAHLETVERQRTHEDTAADAQAHASLVAKAADGLKSAMQQRDECQMELIRCMASGVPAVPVIPDSQAPAQPFFTPGTQGPSSPHPD